MPRIEIATEVTRELVDAFAHLVPQLSSSSPPPTAEELEEIAASPGSVLLIARDGERIVGSLTLVMFRIPTGVRARIEDVVVDADARGAGVGTALSRAALDEAARRGAKTVDLSSRPERTAANRLYEQMGFERRETNVYRFELEARDPGT